MAAKLIVPETELYEVCCRHEDGETWGYNVPSLAVGVQQINAEREDGDGSVTFRLWNKWEHRYVTLKEVKAAGLA